MNSKVHIEVHEKKGVTELKSVFFTTPFKVVNIREDKKKPLLELTVMSASPGILDGDSLDFEYILHENSQLELTTQSFQRFFSMEKSAFQDTKITLKSHAFLAYLPHPNVPHKASNFKNINTIHLEKNAALLWGDILTCGRKTQDEVFEFTKFQSLTKVFQDDKLIFFENLYLNPSEFNPMNLIHFENYTHQLNLLFLDESCNAKTLKMKLDLFLSDKNCLFGISIPPTNGLIIKILDFKAEKLMHLMKEIAKIIKNDRI